ncbi:MAG: hypothetical protein GY827_01705 [Cytophagales bacterium]|nr:hypothetical protein [Cytophagales bacterium]
MKKLSLILYLLFSTVSVFAGKHIIKVENYPNETSNGVLGLYKEAKCTLKIKVLNDGVGWVKNFDVKVEGADTLSWVGDSLLTLIPKSPNVIISVTKGKKSLGEVKLKTRLVPFPDVLLFARGNRVEREISYTKLRGLKLKLLVQDEGFKLVCPEGTKFNPVNATFVVKRDGRIVATGKWKSFGKYLQKIKPGDNLYVRVDKIKRLKWNRVSYFMKYSAPQVIHLSVI